MDTQTTPSGYPAASSRKSAVQHHDPVLAKAVSRGLSTPFHALRTSVQRLTHSFTDGDPRGAELEDVLGQVEHLGRSVQELLDYAYLPEPKALVCTVEEVLYSARYLVPHHLWGCLSISREAHLPDLELDGPILARSLARLVAGAAPLASRGVQLDVTAAPGATSFQLTFHGRTAYVGDPMGLSLTIAARDLAVIGCPISEATSREGSTTLTIRVPAELAVAPQHEERVA
jgi:K+-sensing histidine kinase KdpD